MHKKIKCPKCDNEDLSFVSGTKKGLNVFLLLIVAVLGVAVIITLFVSGYIWGAVIAIIIFSIILSISNSFILLYRYRQNQLTNRILPVSV